MTAVMVAVAPEEVRHNRNSNAPEMYNNMHTWQNAGRVTINIIKFCVAVACRNICLLCSRCSTAWRNKTRTVRVIFSSTTTSDYRDLKPTTASQTIST